MATLYLLDTNILVHLIRGDALGHYIRTTSAPLLTEPRPCISIVTEGELRSLALQWQWGTRRAEQMRFVLHYFWRIPLETPDVLMAYATIDAYSEQTDRSMGKNDVWIAAAAHVLGACLLTTDKDFDHLHPTLITRDWIDPDHREPSQC